MAVIATGFNWTTFLMVAVPIVIGTVSHVATFVVGHQTGKKAAPVPVDSLALAMQIIHGIAGVMGAVQAAQGATGDVAQDDPTFPPIFTTFPLTPNP